MSDSGAGGSNEPGGPNPLDRTFDILTAAERRYTIRLLTTRREPIAIADLAHEMATYGGESRSADNPRASAQRIGEFLYHIHIPKLAEGGVVDFDAERNLISRGAEFETYAAVLQLIDEM